MKKLSIIAALIASVSVLAQPTARVQVIHNSADMAASMVDVYLGSTLLIDDFKFRSASKYIDAPAGTVLTLGIAPSTSMSQADTIVSFKVTLTANETYVVVADGIVSPSGYSPAPAFNLEIYAMGREMASMSGNTDVLVHHGSTDAPKVDVVEVGAGAGTIVDDLAYTEFAGYLELATADYVLEIRDETGATTVASYDAPLSTLGLTDSALVVVASGFLDPSMNSMGEAFGLYVALPSGGDLIPLPLTTATGIDQVIDNSSWSVYPNPVTDILNVNFTESGNHLVELFNSQGQKVIEMQLNDFNNNLDVTSMNSGLYHLKITNIEGKVGMKTISIVK
jgi:hypothetical protein